VHVKDEQIFKLFLCILSITTPWIKCVHGIAANVCHVDGLLDIAGLNAIVVSDMDRTEPSMEMFTKWQTAK